MSKTLTNKTRNNISGNPAVEAAGWLFHYYGYNLTDHPSADGQALGNVRVTFKKDTNGNAEITQEDHYYPFGMRINGQHFTNTELINKFLYNGKELQDQTGYYDYGFRQYEAQLGRWHVVDAMAEKYLSTSPYAYVMNIPVSNIDVMGLWSFPVFFDGVLGGRMSGEGDSWEGATFSGTVPGGSGGEYATIMGSAFPGHFETRTGYRLTLGGYGLNSQRAKASHSTLLGRILRNLKRKKITYDVWVADKTEESDVWVWDDAGWEPPDGEYDGDPPIVKADLSKKDAGELFIYNLRNHMYKHPYLKDLMIKSRFPKPWLFEFLGNGGFGDRGDVYIAGKKVELTIIFFNWKNSANTHLNSIKYGRGVIKITNYNDLNIIVFKFNDNIELYNTILRYFAGGPAPDFKYIRP